MEVTRLPAASRSEGKMKYWQFSVVVLTSLSSQAACTKQVPVPLDNSSSSSDADAAIAAPADAAASDMGAPDVPDVASDSAVPPEDTAQPDVTVDVGLPKEKKPYGVCDDGLQLPHADSTCTEEGAVHCSRIAEEPDYLYNGMAGSHQICKRPYRLTCAKTVNGALSWQISACPSPTPACAALGVGAQTCQENSRGAHCATIVVKFEGTPDYYMCNPDQIDQRSCLFNAPNSSGGGITRCDFPDGVLTNGNSEQQKNETFQSPCAKPSKYALYIFVDECPTFVWSSCFPCPEWPCSSMGIYCLPNLPNKPNPSCVENCEEFKLTKDYKPK